ncbi:GNAT family N-acetyltransferase [Streptomyces sp. enrichment culture]|uniref:GNAT family N-acetyltransferase n=1 Tax=Streptomyces sp. enrichment culture TaxID=1795815 RepID=UPI003F5636D9
MAVPPGAVALPGAVARAGGVATAETEARAGGVATAETEARAGGVATAETEARSGDEPGSRDQPCRAPAFGVEQDPGRATSRGSDDGGSNEDTMDLQLTDEFLALVAAETPDAAGTEGEYGRHRTAVPASLGGPRAASRMPYDDLLDHVADWGPTDTPAGVFHLVPVRLERDLPLISRWMNDPAAAEFWELSGPPGVTEDHLRAQLAGDGRSVPCVGVLDGAPMSYWEIYRADLDPLARHYPARPHDTGLHLLVGGVTHRGRGLGSLLLRAVADLVLARRPSCARVIAEPDIRNTPSVAAFLTAGFRFSAEVDLPAKRAALMVRDRPLRHLL